MVEVGRGGRGDREDLVVPVDLEEVVAAVALQGEEVVVEAALEVLVDREDREDREDLVDLEVEAVAAVALQEEEVVEAAAALLAEAAVVEVSQDAEASREEVVDLPGAEAAALVKEGEEEAAEAPVSPVYRDAAVAVVERVLAASDCDRRCRCSTWREEISSEPQRGRPSSVTRFYR